VKIYSRVVKKVLNKQTTFISFLNSALFAKSDDKQTRANPQ